MRPEEAVAECNKVVLMLLWYDRLENQILSRGTGMVVLPDSGRYQWCAAVDAVKLPEERTTSVGHNSEADTLLLP